MTRNMAVAFFYVRVVLHGLHLIGGLIVWSRAFARLLGSAPPEKLLLTVDLCARYWHFLLVVWLAMFGLLMLSLVRVGFHRPETGGLNIDRKSTRLNSSH